MDRRKERRDEAVAVRAVAHRIAEVVWQADAAGRLIRVDPRPASAGRETGGVDDAELEQLELRWQDAVASGTPYEATFHAGDAGGATHPLLAYAVPLRDAGGEITAWAGSAVALESVLPGRAATRFVSDVAAALSSSLDRAAIVDRFARLAVEHFCDTCAVHLVEIDGSIALAALAEHHPTHRLEAELLLQRDPQLVDSVIRAALHRAAPVVFPARGAERSEQEQHLLGATGSRSAIVVPLVVGERSVGTVTFFDDSYAYDGELERVELALAAARQIAPVLQNITLFEREQRLTARFRFIAQVTDDLFATLDEATILQGLAERLVGEFADCALVLALRADELRIAAIAAAPGALRAPPAEFRDARPFTRATEKALTGMLQARRAHLVPYGVAERLRATLRPYVFAAFEGLRARSELLVPLVIGERTYGAVVSYARARRYDAEDLDLLREIGRRTALALEHVESFARERHLARTLQQATLPANLPAIPGAVLSTIYEAAAETQASGDWYDAFDLDDDRVLLTIGDVMGHGLESAVVMGKLRHALNIVAMYESDPVRIIDAAERILLRRFPQAIATAFVVIYDLRRQTLTYANAGHPAPLLRNWDGTIVELAAEGLPIGVRGLGDRYAAVTRRLDDAALLVLYTNGLFDNRDVFAGQHRLRETLANQLVLYVRSAAGFIVQQCHPSCLEDDAALLALNFVRAEQWSFDAENAKAAQDTRGDFVLYARERATPESDVEAAELIFGEAIGNVVRHAPGPIDIALEWRRNVAVLHVVDRGPGFSAESRPRAPLLDESGRGVWLMQRLGRGFRVENVPGFGTHVSVVLPVRLQSRYEGSSRSSIRSIASHSISPNVRRTPGS